MSDGESWGARGSPLARLPVLVAVEDDSSGALLVCNTPLQTKAESSLDTRNPFAALGPITRQTPFTKATMPAPMLNSLPPSESTHSTPPLSPRLKATTTDEHLSLAADLLAFTKSVKIDGYGLTLGEVVAVARDYKDVGIDENPAISGRIADSVEFLKSKVSSSFAPESAIPADDSGQLVTSVYGVTTGFGGVRIPYSF